MQLPKPSGLQPPGRGRFGLKPPGSAVSSDETGHSQSNNKPTVLSGALLWSILSICLFKHIYCLYLLCLIYVQCSSLFKGIKTRNSLLPGFSQKHASSDALPFAKRKKTGLIIFFNTCQTSNKCNTLEFIIILNTIYWIY